MNAIQKLNDIPDYLQGQFKEREDVVDGLITALVANVHVLLIGPPGTAKSAITVALSGLIEGCNCFQWLLTKFSTPEELFGPYDLAKLKTGQYERITAGKPPIRTHRLSGRDFQGQQCHPERSAHTHQRAGVLQRDAPRSLSPENAHWDIQ